MLPTQTIAFTIGLLLSVIGIAELIPAAIDWANDHDNAADFLRCALISIFFGGALLIANVNYEKKLSPRWVFLLTTLSWVFMSLFAAFPLYYSDLNISFAQAFFESVSAITTTGSTVLNGLDQMSHGVLFWRSFVQWIGGIGVIAFAIIFLPFLRIGGMQLFQAESSDRSEKIMARSTNLIWALVIVYILITVICAVTYWILGMGWFDAANHAMTTIPTGGFSTHDRSFGHFDSAALEYAATFFMFLGGLPFVLYIQLLFKGRFMFFKDDQFKAFVFLLAMLTFVLTCWLWDNSAYTLEQSFRYSIFNIVSVVTTTGYATSDYSLWGSFAVTLFLFMTYLGACAGSTTGGLKVMRLVVVSKTLGRQFKTLIYPNGVFTIRYQGKPLDYSVCMAVLGFLSLYVFSNAILTVLLALTGLDFITSISSAATALANVGPGLGDIVGPAGNFSSLSETAIWLLSAGMLLGRLEVLTVIILFRRSYWTS